MSRFLGDRGLLDSLVRAAVVGGLLVAALRAELVGSGVVAPGAAVFFVLDRLFCRLTYRRPDSIEPLDPSPWSSPAMEAAAGGYGGTFGPRAKRDWWSPSMALLGVAVAGAGWWLVDRDDLTSQPLVPLAAGGLALFVLLTELSLGVHGDGTGERFARGRSEYGTTRLSARAARRLPAVRRSELFGIEASLGQYFGTAAALGVLAAGGWALDAWWFAVPAALLVLVQRIARSRRINDHRVVISHEGLTIHGPDVSSERIAWSSIASFTAELRTPPEGLDWQRLPAHEESWVVVIVRPDGAHVPVWPLSYGSLPLPGLDPKLRARGEAKRLERYRPADGAH